MKKRKISNSVQRAALLATRNAMTQGLAETARTQAKATGVAEFEAAHICGYLSAMADVYTVLRGIDKDGENAMRMLVRHIIDIYCDEITETN